MNTRQHTPGPWHVAQHGNIVGGEHSVASVETYTAIAKSSQAERDANAALIAAAPELLAAIVELSEWMRSHTGPADGTVEMLTRAHYAILAATTPEGAPTPCRHNEMVATGDETHAWKCATCGYVYGS